MERPEFLPESFGPQAVERTFAFLDLSGFTAFTEAEGAKRAVDVLGEFRSCVRLIAARRGVRIAKWLGDGVMLVSTDPGPMVAAVSELIARLDGFPLAVRAGIAAGECLLFEGDDYIGRPVNLAARLSDQAHGGHILADENVALMAPGWVDVVDRGTRRIPGFGRVKSISEVRMARDVRLPEAG
jgi:class 3 adenylate cyclase